MKLHLTESISVAIPTIGRTETLPLVLYSILSQKPKVSEVVILDEAPVSVMETPSVNQVLDLLSLEGIPLKIIRRRPSGGIAEARMLLAEEAKHKFILMVDDDVVLRPDCLYKLVDAWIANDVNWAVPYCFLVSGGPHIDGYIDGPVSKDDPRVVEWTRKHPWFIPYYNYSEDFVYKMRTAGTQAILWSRQVLLDKGKGVEALGDLPREDTYLTTVTGPGMFVSKARCDHFEHKSQDTRGSWDKRMFYKVHEAMIDDPVGFTKVIGEDNGRAKR